MNPRFSQILNKFARCGAASLALSECPAERDKMPDPRQFMGNRLRPRNLNSCTAPARMDLFPPAENPEERRSLFRREVLQDFTIAS